MSAPPEAPLLVRFDLLGRESRLIENYSIDSSFTTFADAFSFTLYSDKPHELHNLELQPVTLSLHGAQQVVGRIDKTEIGPSGKNVQCQGRDYMAELIQCHVDPTLKLKEGMSLEQAILLACGPVGITNVYSDRDVGLRNIRTGITVGGTPAPSYFKEAKLEDFKAKANQRLDWFCQRLTARHGVTLQPGGHRDEAVLQAPHYGQVPAYNLYCYNHPEMGRRNNVESAIARRDLSNFVTYALFMGKKGGVGQARGSVSLHGQSTPVRLPPNATAEDVQRFVEQLQAQQADGDNKPVKKELEIKMDIGLPDTGDLIHKGRIKPMTDGPKTDPGIYRLWAQRDNDSKNEAQLLRTMYRAMAERTKESLSYEAEVKGHRDPGSGAVFAQDTMVDVFDEIRNVFEVLWVEAVTHSYQAGSGPGCQLKCLRPGSYIF